WRRLPVAACNLDVLEVDPMSGDRGRDTGESAAAIDANDNDFKSSSCQRAHFHLDRMLVGQASKQAQVPGNVSGGVAVKVRARKNPEMGLPSLRRNSRALTTNRFHQVKHFFLS